MSNVPLEADGHLLHSESSSQVLDPFEIDLEVVLALINASSPYSMRQPAQLGLSVHHVVSEKDTEKPSKPLPN